MPRDRAHATASRSAAPDSTRPVGLDGEFTQRSRADDGAAASVSCARSSTATEAAPHSRAPMSYVG